MKWIFADTFMTISTDFLKCHHLEGSANSSQMSVSAGWTCHKLEMQQKPASENILLHFKF